MKAKLKVELTIRVEEDDLNLWDLRDVARKYMTEGKFTINNIGVNVKYRDETSITSKQENVNEEIDMEEQDKKSYTDTQDRENYFADLKNKKNE
jgi:hypothetical protein